MTEPKLYPKLELIENPEVEPLTLAEIKIYLRIDGNVEDEILTTMLKTSRQLAEEYMGCSIIRQKWKLTFFGRIDSNVALYKGPVNSVSSIKLYNRYNNASTIDSSKYYLNGKHSLCLDGVYSSHRIEVEYLAGFATDSANIPEVIRQGLLSQIAYFYENRGTGHNSLDHTARLLFNFFRNIRL